jgi:hypothetical protein
MPYNTIPYNTIPYNTIPYNTIPYNKKSINQIPFFLLVQYKSNYIYSSIALVSTASFSAHSRALSAHVLRFIAVFVLGVVTFPPSNGNADSSVILIVMEGADVVDVCPRGRYVRTACGNSSPYLVGIKLLSFVATGIGTDICTGTGTGPGPAPGPAPGPGPGPAPPVSFDFNLSAKDIL